jgi:hypothetical protein
VESTVMKNTPKVPSNLITTTMVINMAITIMPQIAHLVYAI